MTTQPQPQTAASQSLSLLQTIADRLQVQIDDEPQMLTEVLNRIDSLAQLLAEILVELRKAPANAAAPSIPAAAAAPANVRDFLAETLVMTTDDAGKPAFKIKGFPYSEFGVRVWPEILPALEIDPATLRPGPNPLPAGLIVRVKLTDEGKPRKVIGRGDGSAMTDSVRNGSNGNNGSHAAMNGASSEPPEPPPF